MPENLRDRYDRLVSEHLSPAHKLAAGLRALPGTSEAFASTQAAWRFFSNEHLTLKQLFEPVLSHCLDQVPKSCSEFVLVAVDWCNLHYKSHSSKQDRVALANHQDLGYEMFNGLAISDRDGHPIGPLWFELRDATGVHCTHDHFVRQPISVLDEIASSMQFTQDLKMPRTPVFIIDAEADSVVHLRDWHSKNIKFLVRGKVHHTAVHEGKSQRLDAIGRILGEQGRFKYARQVEFEGRSVQQWVTETTITLTRSARQQRVGQNAIRVYGNPLPLRLIVSELRDETGTVLATWYLQTNVSSSVDAVTIVLWYYWRWRVESYHKLLKSAGQCVESWLQKSGEAIARRLAIASMACVIVWRIEKDPSAEAEEVRKLLIRLSGRQMSRRKTATAPALLAGLWVLLATLDALECYDLAELKEMAAYAKSIIKTKC